QRSRLYATLLFSSPIHTPPRSTLFPYTTLFRSWTDNSLQAIERRKRELEEPLAVVKAIRRDRLSPADRLNYDLFRRGLEEQIERSEEHTSELQSPDHLVCRLLLEKKKKTNTT